jgi:prolyl-tRNA editing enzyme YbaK/EbsC (Cys-tRNA(Pro) deacylase)
MADGEPVLVVCAGDRRVNTLVVASMVGAANVKMASADDVRSITGYAIGGVPPIGHPAPVRTLMDTSLLRWPLIYAAAGAHDALFPADPNRLLEVSGATPADVGS